MSEKHRILYVDDEKHSLTAFRMTFEDDFEVFTADNSEDAYAILQNQSIQLIVADQRMPKETGVEFLKRSKDKFPNTIRTILTGYSDLEAIVEAINQSQIYYYFKKPWKEEELKLVFKNAIEALILSEKNDQLTQELKDALNSIENKAKRLIEEASQREDLVKDLEYSNKVKSEFLSVISHELRTPLNPIIGLTSVMLSQQPEGKVRNNLKIIQRCAEDLLNLIDGMLDFIHLDRSASPKLEAINLETLATDLNALAKSLNKSPDTIDITHELLLDGNKTTKLPAIISENQAIRQILRNLISNAFKFTEKGYVKVQINLRTSPSPQLELSVIDTGIGISITDRQRIFDAFTQVDQTITRPQEGLGLGLSICQKLAERLKGNITVESDLGKGSCFRLTIPTEIEPEKALSIDETKHESSLDLEIMLIGLPQQKAAQIKSMLQRLDCRVELAQNETDSILALQQKPIDVILLDLDLPQTNGYDLARLIRQQDLLKRPRIYGIAASAPHEKEPDDAANNIDGYLDRSLKLKEIVNVLQKQD